MEKEIEDNIIREWREFYIDYPLFIEKINKFEFESSQSIK